MNTDHRVKLLLAAWLSIAPLSVGQTAPIDAALDAADLLDRFCRYVRIETASVIDAKTVPSTAGQWDLLRLLERELRGMGATEITLTEHGILMATIPASSTKTAAPVIAWLAHVDTATTLPGAAKPIVHRAYDGRPIVLPDDPTQVLDPAIDPDLRAAIGQDIVTASGKTLLGADDKAGVAAIMAATLHLLRHPEIPHGKIRLCFTPDEEVGKGAAKIDLKQLGAVAAYTVDGEARGRIDNETFSSDVAIVEINGVRIHTGFAKGKLVNSLRLAARFVARLPMEIAPETTSGREGFIHVSKIAGDVGFTSIRLRLSDFEGEGLAAKRALVEQLVAELRAAEPRAQITLKFEADVRNPRAGIERDPRTLAFAQEAMRRVGIEPKLAIIRGGTDGSELTARGLPTPNLSAGTHEFHSVREWVSVQDMTCAAQVLIHLAQVWLERGTELKEH